MRDGGHSLCTTMLSMIAAIGRNRELGKKNDLLWHIPEDMQYFRDTTRGHSVIMGQKTFESIGRPLPNRRNVVLTQDKDFSPEGVVVAYSPEEALEIASMNLVGIPAAPVSKQTFSSQEVGEKKEEEVFVIGGAMVYSLFLKKSDRLYLTLVDDLFPESDVFFPNYKEYFPNVRYEKKSQDSNFRYTFVILER